MSNDSKERHAQQMQRKKAVIDASIAAADIERGLLLINTGNGKGKTSVANRRSSSRALWSSGT